jgi:hypothetical protein
MNFHIFLGEVGDSRLRRTLAGLLPRRVCPFSEVAPPFQKSWIRPWAIIGRFRTSAHTITITNTSSILFQIIKWVLQSDDVFVIGIVFVLVRNRPSVARISRECRAWHWVYVDCISFCTRALMMYMYMYMYVHVHVCTCTCNSLQYQIITKLLKNKSFI